MARSIILLNFVAFFDLLAVGIIVPLIPSYARQLGANHISIGLLGSIYAGFQLLSGPVIGSLSDLKGRKTVLILTLIVCALTYFAMGFSKSVIILLLLRAVLGVFKHTQLLTKALVPDYENDEKKQSVIYGKMAAISGVGITLGPVLGGHIVEDFPTHGFTIIAMIVCSCFLINTGLVYLLPKTENSSKKAKENKGNLVDLVVESSKQIVVELSKVQWHKYWKIFLFQALNSFAMGVYYSNYAIYLKTQFLLTPKHVGYVVSVQGVIGAVSSFLMGYINSFYKHDGDYSIRNYHVFLALSVSLLGIALSNYVFMYMVFLAPLAIGNAVGRLVTLEMLLKKSHGDHRGTLIGASNSVRSLTGVLSPIVSGSIGQFFGVEFVIYASLFATSVGLATSYLYTAKEVTKEKQK
ncbi:major facilitator superfamily domain-containing protein 9-like [Aricia agestis]|uniref:major facilitator superfamily domain-containing protein 9-like n=1 Tax=Aricia agestis TaxID=91739 RepID=UPI001C20AFF4|nr:major facilitator superfamily domain-containing protein 9-like [Aricia agestis]